MIRALYMHHRPSVADLDPLTGVEGVHPELCWPLAAVLVRRAADRLNANLAQTTRLFVEDDVGEQALALSEFEADAIEQACGLPLRGRRQ